MKKLILFFVFPLVCLAQPQEGWEAVAQSFREIGRDSGFASPAAMVRFLDRVEGEAEPSGGLLVRFVRNPAAFLEESGLGLTIVLILLGGLALNLTPCVLPMIPVNIAIIGAGVQSKSRAQGFALGGTYGLGIASVYGLLGLLAVTGGRGFGTLNANPWFNLAIAVVFVVLGLAMFGLFHLDFTRFQSSGGSRFHNRFAAAFSMGAVAALLAGACVAPVVLAVLVLAGRLVADGINAGLLLPFVLGVGMALPWPLAGAGFSVLPKPGRWMGVVKAVFGLLILLLALYYGRLGVRLLASGTATDEGGDDLAAELTMARTERRPVLLYFTADWCRSCKQMEQDTWPDETVQSRLERYRFVKVDATRHDEPPLPSILEFFEVTGLPTWIVLEPTVP